jgi:hypothetical protein
MNYHRWPLLLAAIALLAGMPLLAGDGEDTEPPEHKSTVEFKTGYRGSSTDDELLRVAEYETVHPDPISALLWRSSPYDSKTVGLELFRMNSYDMSGGLELDLDRMVRLDATLDGFIHRLDNDPVANLKATSDIKTVRSSDLDFGVDHQIRVRLYDGEATIRHPAMNGLSFRTGFRVLERDGTRQSLSTSHCTSCHVVAQGRQVDQSTRDVSLGAHFAGGRVDLDYEISGRRFEENGLGAIAPYETALRPAPPGWKPAEDGSRGDPCVGADPLLWEPGCVPVDTVRPFNDRLWYENTSLEVDIIPEVEKLSHKFKARAGVGDDSSFKLTLVQSTTENRNTNLEYDFKAYRASYYTMLDRNLRLNVYAHHEELENDRVFVDLPAIFGPAPVSGYPGYPAPPGVTFQNWRRDDTDDEPVGLAALNAAIEFEQYFRESRLDRTEDRLGFDLVWRPVRRGSMRFGYKYRNVDRDNDVVKVGFDANGELTSFLVDGETTSNTFRVAWNQRVRRRARLHAELKYTTTDNPYANVNGGLRRFAGYRASDGEVIGQASTPKNTDSLQYYELHAFRVADLGLHPSDDLTARASARWSPKQARWSVGGTARYRMAENDELDYTDWERTAGGVGANVMVAGGSKFLFNVGVDHAFQETDAEAIVPLMDG